MTVCEATGNTPHNTLTLKYNVDYHYANIVYNPHNTYLTKYYVESNEHGML